MPRTLSSLLGSLLLKACRLCISRLRLLHFIWIIEKDKSFRGIFPNLLKIFTVLHCHCQLALIIWPHGPSLWIFLLLVLPGELCLLFMFPPNISIFDLLSFPQPVLLALFFCSRESVSQILPVGFSNAVVHLALQNLTELRDIATLS